MEGMDVDLGHLHLGMDGDRKVSVHRSDNTLNCPICFEEYSDKHYPITAPNCGHSICKQCGDIRNSSQCVTCMNHCFYDAINKRSPWSSSQWPKTYAFLESVRELDRRDAEIARLKAVEDTNEVLKNKLDSLGVKNEMTSSTMVQNGTSSIVPNPNDVVDLNHNNNKNCATCDTIEKRERMRICATCAKARIPFWKALTEEELCYAMFCADCCMKGHYRHGLIDYVPWKHGHALSTAVNSGIYTVSPRNALCSQKMKSINSQFGMWKEKMYSFSCPVPLKSDEQRSLIECFINVESLLVARSSETCLSAVKEYCQVLMDSTSRFQQLRQKVNKGKLNTESLKVMRDESQLLLEESPSSFDVEKRGYEETIRQLEQKLKDAEQVQVDLLATMHTVYKYFKRLQTKFGRERLYVQPGEVSRLIFSVSHPMTLVAIEMYSARRPTHTLESQLLLEESPSSFDVEKRGYEETIRQLEQKLKDAEQVQVDLLATMHTVYKYFKRLQTKFGRERLYVQPGEVSRLIFSVSHPMTLVAIEMYSARRPTHTLGHFAIHSSDEGALIDEKYPLWIGEAFTVNFSSRKIELKCPVKMFPNVDYAILLCVDGEADMYHGEGGQRECEVSPGQRIIFDPSDGENKASAADEYGSQFPGFYFMVSQNGQV